MIDIAALSIIADLLDVFYNPEPLIRINDFIPNLEKVHLNIIVKNKRRVNLFCTFTFHLFFVMKNCTKD